jgi:hypothetical protein
VILKCDHGGVEENAKSTIAAAAGTSRSPCAAGAGVTAGHCTGVAVGRIRARDNCTVATRAAAAAGKILSGRTRSPASAHATCQHAVIIDTGRSASVAIEAAAAAAARASRTAGETIASDLPIPVGHRRICASGAAASTRRVDIAGCTVPAIAAPGAAATAAATVIAHGAVICWRNVAGTAHAATGAPADAAIGRGGACAHGQYRNQRGTGEKCSGVPPHWRVSDNRLRSRGTPHRNPTTR